MSSNFGYIDIILLAMIAGFIILRLRSILGRKTGHESKVYPDFTEKKFTMPKNDAETVKPNLDTLEGENKKEFLNYLYNRLAGILLFENNSKFSDLK